MIYFDNAASVPIRDSVLEILNESLRTDYFNPSAIYSKARNLNLELEKMRSEVLNVLNVDQTKYKLVFTSSATEANNTIIKGVKLHRPQAIVFCKGDHSSIVKTLEFVSEKNDLQEVHLTSETIENLLNDNSESNKDNDNGGNKNIAIKFFALSLINSQTGKLIDIELIKNIKKNNRDCWVHLDCVQAFTKIRLDLSDELIDSLTISAHKIGGPKGVAALIMHNRCKINPLLHGGDQEKKLRASTVSYPLIKAFSVAIRDAVSKNDSEYLKILGINKFIRDFFSKNKLVFFPYTMEETSPYILTIIVPNISSDILVRHLDDQNILVATSSACSARSKVDKDAFNAMGIDSKYHKNVLRLSFSYINTIDEVKKFCVVFQKILEELSFLM